MSNEKASDHTSAQPRTPPDGYKTWNEYWTKVLNQPWRTQPEIEGDQQRYLDKRRDVKTDIEHGIYSFRDENGPIKLNRADVEWLLATHESEGIQGPILDWADDAQLKRTGIDLRGADLSGANLCRLPLSGTIAGLRWHELTRTSPRFENISQRIGLILVFAGLAAGIFLGVGVAHVGWATILYTLSCLFLVFAFAVLVVPYTGLVDTVSIWRYGFRTLFQAAANLSSANLRAADLSFAVLNGANLYGAHFERADMSYVELICANLRRAHFNIETTLKGVQLGRQRHDVWGNFVRLTRRGFILDQTSNLVSGIILFCLAAYSIWAVVVSFSAEDQMQFLARFLGPIAIFVFAAMLIGLQWLIARRLLPDALLPENSGALLADVDWGGANLEVVDWIQVGIVGDEDRAALARVGGRRVKKSRETRVEGYQAATRAYRQLAKELQNRGMNEEADNYAYRGHLMQRQVLWGQFKYFRWLGSLILDGLSGFGYLPSRTFDLYVLTVAIFAGLYWCVTNDVSITQGLFTHVIVWLNMKPPSAPGDHFQGYQAVVVSLISFHGRGFFQPLYPPGDKVAILSAIESVIGLFIEITFIATFTQRFFAR